MQLPFMCFMKKILLPLFALTIMFSISRPVSANDTMEQQVEKVFEHKEQSEESDLQKVKTALKKYSKKAQTATEETETLSDEESSLGHEQYQYDKAYSVYPLEMYMITEYQKQNKNFDKLIDDRPEWRVPYKTADGKRGVAYLAQVGNSFEMMSETDDEQGKETWPEEEKIIAVVEKNLGANNKVKEIKYLCNFLYALEMVYVKCDNDSYIIPYAENLEMLNADAGKVKLENGRCYTVEQFMETMNTLFDESIVMNMKDDEVGGALPYRQSYNAKYIIVGSVFAGVVVLLLVWYHHRKCSDRR